MPGKSYTILILPHARSRFSKLHLSKRFVSAVVVVLGVMLLAGAVLPHVLFKLRTQSMTVEQLEQENRQLRHEKRAFESSLDELNQRLDTFGSDAGRLAAALGIEELPSSQPAAGGSVADGEAAARPGELFGDEFTALRSRTSTLDQSFEQINDAWEERERMLASTPNVMPVRGWFSHGYGWRKDPFTSQRSFHRGIDIVAPTGTPIKAPADGVVTRAGRLGPYGKMIDVSHGYGFVTRYAHLSEILVRPGQRINRGDLIGSLGSTGRSTGPHLHYEVFRDGRRTNPWKYLGDKGF